jgi:hypothetical protein
VLLRVPRPSTVPAGISPVLPYWQLAGKKLSLQVIAPNDTITLDSATIAAKLLFGKMTLLH